MHCRRPLAPSLPVAALLSLLATAAACSSSSSPSVAPSKDAATDSHVTKKPDATSGTDASTGGTDAHPDVIIDPNDCVAVGAKPSEDGIGSYCSPGGGQCAHAGTGGVATLCTADLFAPAHEWFCTLPCDTTTNCGPGGGTCLDSPLGQICVPAVCVANLGDAGAPPVDAAAGDAGDAASDAASSDAASGHDGAVSHDATVDGTTDAAGHSSDAATDASKG